MMDAGSRVPLRGIPWRNEKKGESDRRGAGDGQSCTIERARRDQARSGARGLPACFERPSAGEGKEGSLSSPADECFDKPHSLDELSPL